MSYSLSPEYPPWITPVIVPSLIPYITPFKEFRLLLTSPQGLSLKEEAQTADSVCGTESTLEVVMED